MSIDSKSKPSIDSLKETAKMAESYFKTGEDKDQIQITSDVNNWWSYNKFPSSTNVITYKDEVIGFTFILPCNRYYLKQFIHKKIDEPELLDKIKGEVDLKNYDALYLCAAYVKPKLRRKGIILNAFKKHINKLIKITNKRIVLFYWGYSKSGSKLAEKVAEELHISIYKRK